MTSSHTEQRRHRYIPRIRRTRSSFVLVTSIFIILFTTVSTVVCSMQVSNPTLGVMSDIEEIDRSIEFGVGGSAASKGGDGNEGEARIVGVEQGHGDNAEAHVTDGARDRALEGRRAHGEAREHREAAGSGRVEAHQVTGVQHAEEDEDGHGQRRGNTGTLMENTPFSTRLTLMGNALSFPCDGVVLEESLPSFVRAADAGPEDLHQTRTAGEYNEESWFSLLDVDRIRLEMVPVANGNMHMEQGTVYEIDVVKRTDASNVVLVNPRQRVAKKMPNPVDVVRRAVVNVVKDR
ncbi:hypothetical protein AYO21_09141 [Fonsecaea monophora]|uniref:Uncharacterized protein n=1 Tax=Fonsecaea monophora TaxID=254056 RepID=A0A177EYJ8_9EURO|nr:hypothetical protein AYO21_09141 [Fonsecaea monophora]OAG36666.1 hypothetical protein AYO21_09141 [Fonsecaea monophora]